ncbi:MAG: HAD family hydrolase [Planctomycetia bacterium]|jgi:putative hydrolase of the HAD superfamily
MKDRFQKLKAIIFDFGQTLVDSSDGFRMAEKEAQTKLLERLREENHAGIDADRFLSHYRQMRKTFQENSDYSRKSLWEAIGKNYHQQMDLAILEQWESEYWQRVKEKTQPFDETFDVLEKLSGTYRLAAISNTQGQQRRERHRFDELPELERFFEVILVAGDGEIPPKPDPEPFLCCLAKLEVAPDQAIFIGDDWRNDVCGARGVGIYPIWLKHHSVQRIWPAVTDPAPVISDLNELLKLLLI